MKKIILIIGVIVISSFNDVHVVQVHSEGVPIWQLPQANVEDIKEALRVTGGAGIDARDPEGRTALMNAVNDNRFGSDFRFVGGTMTKQGLVETLISYGADVNAKSEQSPREEDHSFANTPMHYAAIIVNPLNWVAMIDYLIRAGGNINAQNSMLETPLMWSTQASLHENLVASFKEMVSNLADVNMQNNVGNTYLHLLIRNKDILGVQYMMEHFGSMSDLSLRNREGWTPLDYAKNELQPESERAILNFRPLGSDDNIKVRDEFGRTPLMLAIIRNDLPFAERHLLQLGAKVNDVDSTKYRNQPIHFAVIRRYNVEPFVTLLLNNKADPNAKNAFGETPLHYLVKYRLPEPGRTAVAKLLIEKGANPNIANKDGETAINMALRIDKRFGERLESLYRNRQSKKPENISAKDKSAPTTKTQNENPVKRKPEDVAGKDAGQVKIKKEDIAPNTPAPTKTNETSTVRPLVIA